MVEIRSQLKVREELNFGVTDSRNRETKWNDVSIALRDPEKFNLQTNVVISMGYGQVGNCLEQSLIGRVGLIAA